MLCRPQCVETLSFLPVTYKCCGVTFPALNIEVSNLILTFSYLWLVGVILFGIAKLFPWSFIKILTCMILFLHTRNRISWYLRPSISCRIMVEYFTHLPLEPHLCVGAITWTNADLLSIGPVGTNFSDIWIEILIFSFKKMWLKMSSARWRPICPEGDELTPPVPIYGVGVLSSLAL